MSDTADVFVLTNESGDTYAIPLGDLEHYKIEPDALEAAVADASDDDVQPYFWNLWQQQLNSWSTQQNRGQVIAVGAGHAQQWRGGGQVIAVGAGHVRPRF